MSRRLDELRVLLGLGADERLEERGGVEAPAIPVARGLQAAPEAPAGAGLDPGLLDRLRAEAHLTPAAGVREWLRAGRAAWWDADPHVWVLTGLQEPVVARGAVASTAEGEWVLDGRGDGAVLRIPTDEGDQVVAARGRSLTVLDVRPGEEDAWTRRVRAAPRAPRLEVEMPAPTEWLGATRASAWLIEEAETLHAAPGLFERVASAGLVARLAAGATEDDPARLLDGLLSGEPGPAARVRRWAEDAPEAVLEALAGELQAEAAALADDLEALDGLVSALPADAPGVAQALRRRRDMLESAAWVLGMRGRAAAAEPALAALDRAAATHASALALAGTEADDLLASVAWQQPDAWWGVPGGE